MTGWPTGVALGALLLLGNAAAQVTYVGSDACKPCHEQKWNDHRVSGHPFQVRSSADAASCDLPLPEGYGWSDVSHVLGGYRWKAHYLDTDGYLITNSGGEPGNNEYLVATGAWEDRYAGEVGLPYTCAGCHTTGYSPTGNQDGLPGIIGTWELPGIQCERCHGPGAAHVATPSVFNISTNIDSCEDCHVSGDTGTVAASAGFIKDHSQTNEIAASPHFFLECVSCHDPHKKAALSARVECTQCHTEMDTPGRAFKSLGRKHYNRGIRCIDCHMPQVSQCAVAENAYQADVRSHLFRINTARDAEMFNEAGTEALGQLTPAYACLGCHVNIVEKFALLGKPHKAAAWARKNARKIHKHR